MTESGANKMRPNRVWKCFLMLCIVCVIIVPEMVFAAEDESHIGNTNHREWPGVCLYADDVSYSQNELLYYLTEKTLVEQIIKDSMFEVRRAPDYQLEQSRSYEIDLPNELTTAEKGTYPVRIYADADHTDNYIDITVTVTAPQSPETLNGKGPVMNEEDSFRLLKMICLNVGTVILAIGIIAVIPKVSVLYRINKMRKEE